MERKMKSFLKVLQFELGNYIKNKSYISTTILFVALIIIGLSIPAIFPGLIPGTAKSKTEVKTEENVSSNTEAQEKQKLGIWDKEHYFSDTSALEKYYPNSEWTVAESEEALKELIKSGTVEAGFSLLGEDSYRYYVKNTQFIDPRQNYFENALLEAKKDQYFSENTINRGEIEALYTQGISSEVIALQKDGASNYFYVYILLFILYFMVLMYGNMIATNVTTEKSTRTIEILVTSTDTNSLLFGKVVAGTIASVLQTTLIIGSGVITYFIYRDAWNGMLDIALNIPGEVLLYFAIFGILGYVFYMFLFGVLGALVSKTEDISKSTGTVQFIFVIVFLVTMYSLGLSDSIWIKVMSYIPFSSCNAMVARISLGTVGTIEIILSLIILIASIGVVGWIGAKVYRMTTLLYGNPIKLKSILKNLKESK